MRIRVGALRGHRDRCEEIDLGQIDEVARGVGEGSRLATYVDLEGERGQYIHTVLTKLIISRELSPP
jgi:hypothetical protein